jgi:hypothetical protein
VWSAGHYNFAMGFKSLNSAKTVEPGEKRTRFCSTQSGDYVLLMAAGQAIDFQQMRVDIDSVLDQSILMKPIAH